MTYAELQTATARYLGLQALADDPRFNAWGPNAINDAHMQLAVELQIPRTREAILSVADAVTPTNQMQTWGVLSAYNATDGVQLSVVTPARENELVVYSVEPRYLLYDPSMASLLLRPAPGVPVLVELYYAVVPAQMAVATDEPFGGFYPEYHHVIALGAARLMLEADDPTDKAVEWVTMRYLSELERFRSAVSEQNDTRPRSEVNVDDAPRTKS